MGDGKRRNWVILGAIAAIGGVIAGNWGAIGANYGELAPNGGGAAGAGEAAALKSAEGLLAQRLVNAAYARTRDETLPVKRVAAEAMVLLQAASKLDPTDVHTLKLLVEAAKANGAAEDVRKEALRKIIKLDPGDMVAQVAYLDLVASGSQVLEERAKVYRGALAATGLDPQIRSLMAVRLARLESERGETDVAAGYLKQAVALNDVNVEALRALAQMSGRDPGEQLRALIALLTVTPYEPEAWVRAGGILGSTGVHDRAADALVVGLEQMAKSGESISGELYLQLALEYAAAGRTAEASSLLSVLAKLPDAPMSAMMASELLATEYTAVVKTPGGTTAPAGAATTAPEGGAAASAPAAAVSLPAQILKRLGDAIAADPKSAPALAEGVWVELSGMPEVAPEAEKWMKSYEGMAGADDVTLGRLRGWKLLRDGKLEEAEGALSKLSASDPLSQLGLARVLIAEKKTAEAGKQLQDLWSSHPTGLLAFQVAQTARMAHVTLAGTGLSKEMTDLWGTLPARAALAHRSPRDQELVSVNLSAADYQLGQPVLLTVKLTNTSERAVPVGEDGVLKTTVGLTAKTQGMGAKFFGMYDVENLQRVYRLERRGSIEATVRADVSVLGEIFQMNPTRDMTIGMTVLTAPRGSTQAAAAGLGGQEVSLPDFERVGVRMEPAAIQKLVGESSGLALDKGMLRGELLAALVAGMPKEFEGAARDDNERAGRESVLALRGSVVKLLEGDVGSDSAVMRAWMLQVLPADGVNETIQGKLEGMATDGDVLVRMMWAMREAGLARGVGGAEGDKGAMGRLEKAMAAEGDAGVKQWMGMLVEDEKGRAGAGTRPGVGK